MSKSDLIYEVNRLIRDTVFNADSKASIIGDSAFKGRQIVEEAYKQGREDAIEEVLQKMKELKLDEHCPVGCHCSSEQDSCPYNECNNDVIRILEQLKEQKNE